MKILKNRNRTLLEVDTGVLVLAVLATLLGVLLPLDQWGLAAPDWHRAIWVAAILDILSFFHMYRSLDRALDFDEGNASRLAIRGYLIRYLILACILAVSAVTGLLNPLILCLGYLLIMKGAAYLQPYTHRFYNWIFHEQDPVPEPVEDEKQEVENTHTLE